MYNYSKNLTYRSDLSGTTYRKELLECFYLKEYSDNINIKIGKLYKKVKEYYKEIIKIILKNNPMIGIFSKLDDETCFTYLFAWEYFYENHLLLQCIQNNPENTKDMIILLKRKLETTHSNKK